MEQAVDVSRNHGTAAGARNRGEPAATSQATHVFFPPALVPALRERIEATRPCLAGVDNEVLNELVTVAFFAGLETYEAERYPVRVVFIGRSPLDVVLPEPQALSAAPIYRWKGLRFEAPRPFSVRELVKLAVVAADDRIYTMVRLLDDGLAITGLAREGVNFEGDPFLKLIVSRPGGLSIRTGRDRILDYEHGLIVSGREDLLLARGAVRQGLEAIAASAAVEPAVVLDYLDAVRALVREMAAHRHGGILVISPDEDPELPRGAPYRMVGDSSLATLLKLYRLLGRSGGTSDTGLDRGRGRRAPARAAGQALPIASTDLLRSAFLTETERVIEEVGALTAIDGATVLNRSLALVGFGVTLPVASNGHVMEAGDPDGRELRPFDLGSRGTRHRAGASYADQHAGSVVFVASQDGPVSCMLRRSPRDHVVVWRLGPGDERSE